VSRILLAADVGNTRAKFALLKASQRQQLPETLSTFLWKYDVPFARADLQAFASSHGAAELECFLSGSHLGHIEEIVEFWPKELPEPRVIRSSTELPIELLVDYPDKVGVDRVLNAIATRFEQPGVSAIIIDTGTATTVDVVSSSGAFLGGAILPGYELSAHALHDYTNKLPLIPLQEILGEVPAVVGKNTHAALRSGLIWGQVGAVNEVVTRIQQELAQTEAIRPTIYLTGGAADLLQAHLNFKTIARPQLTLQGLACVAER
tara:strand:- start:155 stop:943 length:789 start_codon:yes stop_codon:yes gene_type:complete